MTGPALLLVTIIFWLKLTNVQLNLKSTQQKKTNFQHYKSNKFSIAGDDIDLRGEPTNTVYLKNAISNKIPNNYPYKV